MTDTTLTLEWDPPQGSGPEAIVDSYTISISNPMSQPLLFPNLSSPWNITLAHNTSYSIGLAALNCAGDGAAFFLPTIEYSEENRNNLHDRVYEKKAYWH